AAPTPGGAPMLRPRRAAILRRRYGTTTWTSSSARRTPRRPRSAPGHRAGPSSTDKGRPPDDTADAGSLRPFELRLRPRTGRNIIAEYPKVGLGSHWPRGRCAAHWGRLETGGVIMRWMNRISVLAVLAGST